MNASWTMGWQPLSTQEAYDALSDFARTRGRDALLLLMHASVPETLRPDLLHLIQINFLAGPSAPSREADVLFAPFTISLGSDYYRVDPQVRWHGLALLRSLHRDDPRGRDVRVAELLWRHLEDLERRQRVVAHTMLSEYIEVQRWVALAYLEPRDAAHAFAEALRAVEGQPIAACAQLGGLAAAMELPLAGEPELLTYARGLDALARGNADHAARLLEALGDQPLRVADVTLRAPQEWLSTLGRHGEEKKGMDANLSTTGEWPRLFVRREADRLEFTLIDEQERHTVAIYPDPEEQLRIQALIERIWSEMDAMDRPESLAPGEALYLLIIPADLRSALEALDHLVLRLDGTADRIPWEMMWVGGPWALERRMVRQLESPPTDISLRSTSEPWAFVIGSPSTQSSGTKVESDTTTRSEAGLDSGGISYPPLMGAEMEFDTLVNTLRKAGFFLELAFGVVDAKNVYNQLYRHAYRLLHIVAHGVIDQRPGDGARRSGVVLCDGTLLTAAEFGAMEIMPQLVFLHVAHLGRTDLARSLLEMDVRAVIVCGGSRGDPVGRTFAEEFYRHFLNHRPFGEAVFLARRRTFELHKGAFDVATYLAYGDPALVLDPPIQGPVKTDHEALQRRQLFISASREDREWGERLRTKLLPLIGSHGSQLWDKTELVEAAGWEDQIGKAISRAKVALLLVSPAYLASETLMGWELPLLLRAARKGEMTLLWVCLEDCLWQQTPLAGWKALLDPRRPLGTMNDEEREVAFTRIASAVASALPVAEAPLQSIPVTHGWVVKEGDRWQVKTEELMVEGYREELAPGVALKMLKIPAGSFRMGSLQQEERWQNAEGPPHEVRVREFFLAQTPITQAQWQVVAGWGKVERDLDPDPSRFKGADCPVEQVSWHEAMEFCSRLSRRTGRTYTLPSEAQWEYACRAGTTTPFHYGETITSKLANFNGSFAYGGGPKGRYRQYTTDVGSFPANAWGLHDMHGNVREWCEDHWHDKYVFAPENDQPWLIPEVGVAEARVLRGGSWGLHPDSCRSASRYRYLPSLRSSGSGFRVCALHPARS